MTTHQADEDQADESKGKPDQHKHIQVRVENEDDGDSYPLNAKSDDALQSVIDDLYSKKIRRERRDTDRLRCKANGEDVFGFAAMSFEDYLAAGHCVGLVWLFSGATGGA